MALVYFFQILFTIDMWHLSANCHVSSVNFLGRKTFDLSISLEKKQVPDLLNSTHIKVNGMLAMCEASIVMAAYKA